MISCFGLITCVQSTSTMFTRGRHENERSRNGYGCEKLEKINDGGM